jgi:hypothetical protein
MADTYWSLYVSHNRMTHVKLLTSLVGACLIAYLAQHLNTVYENYITLFSTRMAISTDKVAQYSFWIGLDCSFHFNHISKI